jgi:flagellar biosynthesis/type III secretory pathway chaperone
MNVQQLIEILTCEQKTHEQLMQAKREERKWLTVGDAPQLLKNTERISDLVDRIRDLEEQRMDQTRRIAAELGVEKPNPTLKDILSSLPPAEGIELEKARQSLKATLHALRAANRSNSILLQRSVETIREELKQFAQFAPEKESGVYTARGILKQSAPPRASLNLRA